MAYRVAGLGFRETFIGCRALVLILRSIEVRICGYGGFGFLGGSEISATSGGCGEVVDSDTRQLELGERSCPATIWILKTLSPKPA